MKMILAAMACVGLMAMSPVRADETVLADFDGTTFGKWVRQGDAMGTGPTAGTLEGQNKVTGFKGSGFLNSYHNGDTTTGTLTSPEFEITKDILAFKIGGGKDVKLVGIELLVAGKRVKATAGQDTEELLWCSWDVSVLRGKKAQLRIYDNADGGWGHILIDQIVLCDDAKATTRPVGRIEAYRQSGEYYREPYRPQFHFTPEIHWMNDPNGLVYFAGEWHLFYQYNPLGIEWGHMSWGHAVSTDLVHWKHLPIALHEEYDTMIFSGSAVVDADNTSGFGKDGQPPLVAIYTGHGHGKQTQDIAYSTDKGRTWTKYQNNPVLDLNESEFRDPKVFWHKPSKQWIMVVSMAAKKVIQFYGSPDLKTWKFLSDFGPAGVEDKPNWECPDLFELPIVGEPGKTRWVLETDIGSGSIAGGSGGEYFTGTFDGKRFTADSMESQWVDYGRDFYAPVSWSDVPDSDARRIWIGWMNNWQTALNPTYPWRSAMSIPRSLHLEKIDGKLHLCQQPVKELEALRGKAEVIENKTLTDETAAFTVKSQQCEVVLEVKVSPQAEFGLRVLKGDEEQTEVLYRTADSELSVDRTKSGKVDFHDAFAGVYKAPLALPKDGILKLRVFVDRCSVEVFANRGEIVQTNLVFPSKESRGIELFSKGSCEVLRATVYPLDSTWRPKTGQGR
jgi:fructan beta-fructosidase